MQGLSFLYATHPHDLFYTTVKYHQIFQTAFKLLSRHENVYRRMSGWTDRRQTDVRLIVISPKPFSRGIKMRGGFALQKLLTFLNKTFWHFSDINVWNFNETLTNDVISFEQPAPGLYPLSYRGSSWARKYNTMRFLILPSKSKRKKYKHK